MITLDTQIAYMEAEREGLIKVFPYRTVQLDTVEAILQSLESLKPTGEVFEDEN